jgi:hypothetical protein
MARETSIAAYNKIKTDGSLSNRRWEVYDVLFQHGPLTASEIEVRITSPKSPSRGSNVHARLIELEERGVAREVGQVACSVSGMTVIQWDVTAIETPLETVRRRTSNERISALTESLGVATASLARMGAPKQLLDLLAAVVAQNS